MSPNPLSRETVMVIGASRAPRVICGASTSSVQPSAEDARDGSCHDEPQESEADPPPVARPVRLVLDADVRQCLDAFYELRGRLSMTC